MITHSSTASLEQFVYLCDCVDGQSASILSNNVHSDTTQADHTDQLFAHPLAAVLVSPQNKTKTHIIRCRFILC